MALTRKMLAAMDIPAEKIDEIITAHTETVNALKEERDSYKANADKLSETTEALNKAQKDLADIQKEDWKAKYEKEHSDFESFKTNVAEKETKATKETAYKKALTDAGIPEKRHSAILKVTDMATIELNADGTLKNAKAVGESIKSEWADFIVKERAKGADVSTPPDNNGDGTTFEKMSLAEKMAYANEHPGDEEVRNWLK